MYENSHEKNAFITFLRRGCFFFMFVSHLCHLTFWSHCLKKFLEFAGFFRFEKKHVNMHKLPIVILDHRGRFPCRRDHAQDSNVITVFSNYLKVVHRAVSQVTDSSVSTSLQPNQTPPKTIKSFHQPRHWVFISQELRFSALVQPFWHKGFGYIQIRKSPNPFGFVWSVCAPETWTWFILSLTLPIHL